MVGCGDGALADSPCSLERDHPSKRILDWLLEERELRWLRKRRFGCSGLLRGVSTERRERTEKKAEEQRGGEMIRPRTLHVTFRDLAS